jgi:hypothetical protein
MRFFSNDRETCEYSGFSFLLRTRLPIFDTHFEPGTLETFLHILATDSVVWVRLPDNFEEFIDIYSDLGPAECPNRFLPVINLNLNKPPPRGKDEKNTH